MADVLSRSRQLVLRLLTTLVLGVYSHTALAMPSDAFDATAALTLSQAAVGRQIGDHKFIDHDGNSVQLTDYRGQPLIISLIFTACTHTCPLITQSLAGAVETAQEALGTDSFQTVTVGFDPTADTPERLHDYVKAQGIDLPNWRFLSGDAATIDALIQDLGFIKIASARGFDHLAQTSVIDSDGKVYQQVYGDTFGVTAVVDPLKAAMSHSAAQDLDFANIIERVRLFCTLYDPSSNRYAFDYSFFISIAVGSATLFGLGFILVGSWLRSRKAPLGPL
jgi:protein SCO1